MNQIKEKKRNDKEQEWYGMGAERGASWQATDVEAEVKRRLALRTFLGSPLSPPPPPSSDMVDLNCF
jgi:hypothetical protein